MRELIYDNVRIQFLSEEVLRLEVRYGAYFTDRNTLWIPDRGAFEKAGKRLAGKSSRSQGKSGRQQSLVVREEAAQDTAVRSWFCWETFFLFCRIRKKD